MQYDRREVPLVHSSCLDSWSQSEELRERENEREREMVLPVCSV